MYLKLYLKWLWLHSVLKSTLDSYSRMTFVLLFSHFKNVWVLAFWVRFSTQLVFSQNLPQWPIPVAFLNGNKSFRIIFVCNCLLAWFTASLGFIWLNVAVSGLVFYDWTSCLEIVCCMSPECRQLFWEDVCVIWAPLTEKEMQRMRSYVDTWSYRR